METFHAWSNAWKYNVKLTINQRKTKLGYKRYASHNQIKAKPV